MATIEIGGVGVELPRRGNSEWYLQNRKEDTALGPVIILQKQGNPALIMFIQPTREEVNSLRDWCEHVIKHDLV